MIFVQGLSNLLPLGRAGSFWFPPQSSSVAAGHDFVYDLVLWLCIIFFVAICGATLYFMVKYRKRPGHKEEVTSTHNTKLEVTWSLVPLALLMVVFFISTYWYLEMITPPEDDVYELNVTAQKWRWTFKYSGEPVGGTYFCKELHLIKGQAYQAVMTAPDNDVLHSMFIPAFRIKQDCVPGRYNRLWFRPIELSPPEGFDLFCTEYCGDSHSNMITKVHVYETEAEWIAGIKKDGDLKGLNPEDRGRAIHAQFCSTCHTVDGKAGTGPSWAGMWGKDRELADGTVVPYDENYVRQSVLEPNAKIAGGFAKPSAMTPFDWGTENELYFDGIIAYMKTLK
ncbi:MAG: cytochrome c oxidase subunit II [Planctomycetes bacterium]|nr:cytochrome c oxidase subunit II [Planctomycetota bacterium]